MGNIWRDKFVFWNLIALIFIKAIFSFSGLQMAEIMNGLTSFTKEDIITQTNILRSASGLERLEENKILDIAADQKLQDMIKNQYFAHTSPGGASPWHWIESNNYRYVYAGENLAIGFATAADTINAWANSPSHRANLLDSHFKQIGVAIGSAKIQDSEGFLVVQVFGTPAPVLAKLPAKQNKTITAASPAPIAQIKSATTSSAPLIPRNTFGLAENNSAPILSKTTNTDIKINKITHGLNAALILYVLMVFLGFVVTVVLYGLKKNLVIKTAASFAILLLAVTIPVFNTAHTALII